MIELVEGRKHQVIKRDGRYEPYNPQKMYKVLLWACNGSEVLAKELLKDIDIKVYDKISISRLFDEVIETAANKISEMFPIWDDIARNLFLQKIYKEVWGIKRDEYPDFAEVLKKGVSYGIYNKEIVESFSDEEIEELHDYIKQERDFNLSYLGLRVFMDKYSAHYTSTKNLELPQHGFMRLAMFAFWKEPKEERIQLIKQRYDDMSLLYYSEATPKWLNSLTYNPQMASCVVSKMPDNSWGINKIVSNLGLFSKYGGGLACDVSDLRATGSKIRKSGESSGPIPFIRMIESVVSAYNQLGKRNGACAVYFPWWHYDAPEMIELKEEGGTEDRRARKLQYGVKWNNLFTKRILNDEEITLFDPKDTPELLETWGEEFEKWYLYYEEKKNIKKKKILAIDLAYQIAKQRIETGNIYIFFEENVQNQNIFNDKIYSSNLCSEIYIPSKAPEFKSDKLEKDLSTEEIELQEKSDPGLIALCNLSSINLVAWDDMTPHEKEKMIYNLLRASDNLLDYAYYPSKSGEIFNKEYRAIGVGVTNLAQYLAKKGVSFSDEEALKIQNDVMEEIYWYLMNASIDLAEERGRFPKFFETKYREGLLTFDLYNGPYNFKLNYDWDLLRERLLASGARFSTVMAIAPTATSGLILNSTEGIEPLRKLVSIKTGTYNCKQLAPNLNKYRGLYEIAWDILPEKMVASASVRQRWLDQGQSFSLYYRGRNESAYEVLKDILFAEREGLKGLYYAHSPKDDEEIEEVCESCSA
jgi:ribonucleoside-diphosphate reductase alpha chain